MRARIVVVCLLAAAAVAVAARACTPVDGPGEPTPSMPLVRGAGDAAEPEAPEEPPRAAPERVRAHVRAPEQEPAGPASDADTRPAITVDGWVPEQDRGTGDSVVDIRIVDAATEQVVESRVRLWRLGVPADDRWPAGDHIQGEFGVRGTHRVEDLPAGRYRLQIWAAAPGTEDPPEFEVHDGLANTFTARIDLPAEVAMLLRVYDEHGVLRTEGERRSRGPGTRYRTVHDAPAWARPRVLRAREASGFFGGAGGRSTLFSSRSWSPVTAESRGFELGAIRRPGTNHGWSRGYTYRFPDRTDVRVRARSRDAVDTDTYVGVSVPAQPLIDSIRLPDGTRATDGGAEISIVCGAVPALPGSDGLWRTVPINVTAKMLGYQKLEFSWCIAEGTPRTRTMQELESVDD